MADPPQFRNFEDDLYHGHQRSSGRGVESIDSVEGEGIGLQQPIDVRNSYSGLVCKGHGLDFLDVFCVSYFWCYSLWAPNCTKILKKNK